MYAIETRALTKRFRRKRALDLLEMHVPRGVIYGLVGRNGSGKSTAMKIICGMTSATSGEVVVMGETLPACGASPRVGSLVEAPGIYPDLSGLANMMSKALALGVVDARRHSAELLELVGLDPALKQRASSYSMGMKQRLGLALALVGNPDILLLDEPTNGLDPESARTLRELMVQLNRERGMTVVISSHILDQLERICHTYGVIKDGRMVRELSAQEVDEACAGGLTLSCAAPERALALMAEHMPAARTRALPGGVLRIEDAVDAAAVGTLLMEQGIAIFDLHAERQDVEEFFVGLMGGDAEGRARGGAGLGREEEE